MRGLPAPGLRVASITLLAMAAALVPARAEAWTDATVRTATAEIRLTPEGGAHVTLHARVRVDGGWLEGMELEGLDDDATLDPDHPLTFRDASGTTLPVQVTPHEGGRVSLRFTRRTAPHRGEYDIDLAWVTALEGSTALDADTAEARWVFPAWRFGLDGVEIRWLAPEGSTAEPEDEITAPIEIETTSAGADTVVTYRRAHLPRTSDWETLVRVPRAAWPHAFAVDDATGHVVVAGPGASPDAAQGPITVSATDEPEDPTWLALAIALALGALLKRFDLEARAHRARRTHGSLVRTPGALFLVVVAALLAATAAGLWLGVGRVPALTVAALLVVLGWQRPTQEPARPRVLPLTPVTSHEIARCRRETWTDWLGPSAWVEPARLGLPLAAAALVAALDHDAPTRLFAALLLLLIVSGTRARIAGDAAHSVRALSRVMETLSTDLGAPFVSLRLLGRGAQEPHDLRLHVSLADDGARARLLEDLRVEIVQTDARGVALRVAAREGSGADVALRAWADSENVVVHEIARRAGGGRRALLLPISARAAGATVARVSRGILALAPHESDATLGEVLADAAE